MFRVGHTAVLILTVSVACFAVVVSLILCALAANKPWYFKAPEKRKHEGDSSSKQKYCIHILLLSAALQG